ncbi:MAG TPA: GGDEF domain-containing protein, partial [Acidimicrobiales bacterium]
MLRHFAPRRTYFVAWTAAWACLAAAILALVARSFVVPALIGRPLGGSDPAIRLLYLVYQTTKVLGFVLFVRGTAMYVAGVTGTVIATNWLWAVGVLFALVSTVGSPHGLDEIVIWQSAAAVPAFGYCAWVLLGLPRPRRTAGSMATGTAFALLAVLWLVYAGAFGLSVYDLPAAIATHARTIVAFNAYLDLTLDVVLGYAMILLLMEDAKREVDDAQAELRVTHDQLRRAALYDALTDSLNRHAFAEGVGLDMVRATFGTVVLADLDNLKHVNDRLGHGMGDRLIRHCADVLRTTLRPYDKL